MGKKTNVVTLVCIAMSTVFLLSCSRQTPDFGKWETKSGVQEYRIIEDDRSVPFPSTNPNRWVRVKTIGEQPATTAEAEGRLLVRVVESGFIFLESTDVAVKDDKYENVQWGWKVVLENKSKKGVRAYAGYSLLDKDDFVLISTTEEEWSACEEGIYIGAGERVILKAKMAWLIKKGTTPYPPSRAVKGDYKLFLRVSHGVFDDLADK